MKLKSNQKGRFDMEDLLVILIIAGLVVATGAFAWNSDKTWAADSCIDKGYFVVSGRVYACEAGPTRDQLDKEIVDKMKGARDAAEE